jgi:prevent-host-death family protein
MATASIAELKAKLSAYLDVVKSGEEVVVTDRGHAIARVVPFTQSGATPAEYEEMFRSGQIIPPKKKKLPADFWTRPRARLSSGDAVSAVIAEREEGW